MKLFNAVPSAKRKYNKFDLSHEKKLSMKFSDLVPIYLEEVIPGDKFQVNAQAFIRLAPMLAPIMHRVNVFTHFFFVPNRLVWDEWEDFITGGKDGLQEPIFPTINSSAIGTAALDLMKESTLWDYMGLPTCADIDAAGISNAFNVLPFRAYQLIYNEYYRDEKLTDEIDISKDSGPDTNIEDLLTIRKRSWEKDYLTSANTDPQLGEEIGIPIDITYKDPALLYKEGTTNNAGVGAVGITGATGGGSALSDVANADLRIENIDDAGVTVNQLRRSIKLQEWLEKNARAGYRYIEQILSHFGVVSKDARLQRPEFLGGGVAPVVISEVLNNTSISTEEPLGTMAGHGMAIGKTNSFRRYFTEHGYIIGIMSVIPKATYMEGIHRTFKKFDKFDFYWPEFASIGEQAIRKDEVFLDYSSGENVNEEVWGYAPRYSEYKFGRSTVHGQMRSSLDFWHIPRKFGSLPALNATFIECERDGSNNIFAVEDDDVDKLYVQIFNSVKALRNMPYFGSPKI